MVYQTFVHKSDSTQALHILYSDINCENQAITYDLITSTGTRTYALFCDKTRVPMFYLDSYVARPIVPI